MRVFPVFPPLAALGAGVLLAECAREPQTRRAAEPILLQQRASAHVRARLAPAPSASAFSADEKQRLFQAFQASQSPKGQAVTTREATP